jgi:hypothetical protein
MKLKIWDEKTATTESEDQVFLKFRQKDDDIFIDLVKKDGERVMSGTILVFDQDLKCIVLADSVSDDYPLKTEADNSPILISEEEAMSLIRRTEMTKMFGDMAEKMALQQQEQEVKH